MHPVFIPELTICNTGSVINMVKRAGGRPVVVSKPTDDCRLHKFILPGVGSFDSGIAQLEDAGWKEFLKARHEDGAAPMLGICLGMQMLFESSEEGSAEGLGLIPGKVVRFRESSPPVRIPHMGWNEIDVVKDNPLVTDTTSDARRPRFYFVHTYHAVCDQAEDVIATVHYGSDVTAAARRGKVYGVQFHPEKSHRFGLELIKRFIEM